MSEQPSPRASLWPHVRAALVLLHLLAVTLMALPAPSGAMNRDAWKEPTVQGEFAAWSKRLGVPQDVLEERAWRFATGFMEVREAALAPFMPYYRYFGTWQSWRMFVAPHRVPSRFVVELDRGDGFEPIYVQASTEHTWRGRQLDHDRLRAQIFRLSWPGYEATYSRFATWLARQAAADFPDGRRLRTRFYEYGTRSPEEVRAGVPEEGRYTGARIFALDKYR